MATLRIEGFDKYGQPGILLPSLPDLLAEGKWSLSTLGGQPFNIVGGLSSQGNALQIGGEPNQKVFASQALSGSYARLIGGFRCKSNIQGLVAFGFYDNFTAQLSICIERVSGFLSLRVGDAGDIIQLSPFAISANTIHYIEYDITFNTNGTLGGWSIWLDGAVALVGTGVTSQSGNNFANVVEFATYPINFFTSPGVLTVDDMYIFDDTTSFNNSALLSQPAVVTDFPSADALKQFGNNGNVIGNYSVITAISGGNDFGFLANNIYLMPIVPNVNCTINSLQVWVDSNSVSANFKGVIYSDSGGSPNSLMSDGLQVTGCALGTLLSLPLVTPQNLTAGQTYWVGFIGDTNAQFFWYDGATLSGRIATNTYSGGPPSTAPSMTAGQRTLAIAGYCSGAATNWESEALNPPIGDVSSVGSGTSGDEDLYTYPVLSTNAVVVYTVAMSTNCRLSFPGVHTFSLVAFSSGTPGSGSNINISPTINYSWYDSFFDTDPHTSAAWTPTDVTNAVYGMGVTS